jgi:cell wall-associated NlpC family hydrolase
MTGIDYSRIRHQVVRIARANLGYDDNGTNSGQFIRAMGGRDGQDWCALFAGYCYRRAYEELGLSPPVWAFTNYPASRGKLKLQLGAKALTKGLGRAGRMFREEDMNPAPGDLVCWSRGLLGWQGHVGIVTEGGQYIAGNEGRSGRVHERPISACHLKLWRFATVQP